MKKGVRTYTLPGQEIEAETLMNNDLIEITTKTAFACPKEGIILLYLEFDDYTEKGAF